MPPHAEQPSLRNALMGELRPMVRLAAPVVAAEMAWMAMGLVDTVMAGRVSALVMGAVGMGHALFFAVVVMGMGVLLSLDYYVSKAHGAGDAKTGLGHLIQGLWLSLFLSPPLMALLAASPHMLTAFGVEAPIVTETAAYLSGVVWGLPGLLVMTALRRYLQAVDLARPIMVVIIVANGVNVVADWALIFGHLGAPAMGAEGAGWASSISRLFMAAALGWVTASYARRQGMALPRSALAPDFGEIVTLIRLGAPAAGQLLLEVAMFSMATVLVGRMDTISLAAHQVALQVASFTFMMPLGISSAGAVRVAHGLGRGDKHAAVVSGWVALGLGVGCMAVSAILLGVFREPLVRGFTSDAAVWPLGASLLLIAAVFQLFDAVQVVGTGILRGLGNTRASMLANLVGHWMIGLPVGAYFAFVRGWGAQGLWLGLCLGLMSVAVTLTVVWVRNTRPIVADG